MNINGRSSFAFLVLAYNHESYILEHLESIKFLVERYGSKKEVDLIVSDDCSTDLTQKIVDCWLRKNRILFRNVKTLYNKENLGTCKSVNNMLIQMEADQCKLTAGDDVYSYENIFELSKYEIDVAFISGIDLYLLGNKLHVDQWSKLFAIATQEIYKYNSLLHRFKHFSYNSAPNILYATECLMDHSVRSYLQHFDVIEDWPLQIAIARKFNKYRFKLIDRVLVYYRRTAGSTYIVANSRFKKDKVQIYEDLILDEKSLIGKVRLISRKLCFKTQKGWINRFLNLDFYFFMASFFYRILSILKIQSFLKIDLARHQKHYYIIQSAAINERKKLNIAKISHY